jgi:calcium/calmodulin-dependent 3',5'-cyclic nucleotide phosphodiesterase
MNRISTDARLSGVERASSIIDKLEFDVRALDANEDLGIGMRSTLTKKVEKKLENRYTNQFKNIKKKQNRQAFTQVKKDTDNLACLNFDHDNNTNVIPNSKEQYFKNIDSWNWSPVLSAVLTSGRPLRYTLHHIFTSYEFFQKGLADENYFYAFVDSIENAYQKNKNPYHNSTHAADVLQTTHHIINATGMYHWLSDLELMAMLFAAAIHDTEHTGTTNDFHVLTRSPLAILYNDQSVLENHHLAVTWNILKQPECNVLSKLDHDELEYFTELVNEMVLATDMAQHFPQFNEIKNTIESTPKSYWKEVLDDRAEYPSQLEKPKIMSLIVHAADISNALKPWHLHQYTTSQVLQEFFNQGDMCKLQQLTPAPLCDRRITDIPMSQINFAKFLVKPTFDLLTKTMRLLAEVFLPESQKLQKEFADSESTNGSCTVDEVGRQTLTARNTLGFNLTKITKFKRHSLRPNTTNISAQDVIKRCDKFDMLWNSCMKDNTRRWAAIINATISDQEFRKSESSVHPESIKSDDDRISHRSKMSKSSCPKSIDEISENEKQSSETNVPTFVLTTSSEGDVN